jgi:hypothetical protein
MYLPTAGASNRGLSKYHQSKWPLQLVRPFGKSWNRIAKAMKMTPCRHETVQTRLPSADVSLTLLPVRARWSMDAYAAELSRLYNSRAIAHDG